ncbi:MAG: DsbA family protein [Rhodobacteraceae bacterium]|jgi:protein-disulfide isomerase|nr:DsbA family protein [Paracoccaceae bacterium]
MTTITRRVLLAMAAALAASPVLAQDTETSAPADPAPSVDPATVKDFSIGSADAPIKITEYASYTCPHCARFHADVFAQLKLDYIDTGKVYFTMREVYFDRYGLWAALVARCGGDMKYFGIQDMLFDQQQDWAAQQDPSLVVQKLRGIGLAAGLTNEQLDACLQDTAMVEAMVKHFEEGMQADAIEGTPTLIIDGEKHPNMSYGDLKTILDAKLGG